jgi:phosphonate transport system substrate-binding protein
MKYAVRQKFAQQQARAATVRRRLRVLASAAVLMITGAMAVPAVAPTVFKVRPGDTFSGIAAKLTGKARDWNKLYDPQRSQLPDPDYILPGMRFQLVSQADGSRYLRLATPAQLAQAKAEAKAEAKADKNGKRLAGSKSPVMAAPAAAAAPAAIAPRTAPSTAAVAPATLAPATPVASPVLAAARPMPVPVPVPVPVSVPVPSPAPASNMGTLAKSAVVPVPVPVTLPAAAPTLAASPKPTPLAVAALAPAPAAPAPAVLATPLPPVVPKLAANSAAAAVLAAAPMPAPTAVGLTAAAKPSNGQPPTAVPVPLPSGLTPNAPTRTTEAATSPAKAAALTVAAAAVLAPMSAGGDTLVVGVMPNIAAPVLTAQYDNLKTYLERSLSQKVRVVVPASMKAYFEAMLRGDYDLAIGGPHFARLAQVDARLVPVAMFEPRTNAQFVTLLDGPMKSPRDLRGKAVVFSNPQSLVALYGRQWLTQQNLEQGKDYDVKSARTDLGVGRMLLSGDAVAAVMSSGEFRSLPADEAARLKIVEVIARIPNFVVMAHPRLGAEHVARLKAKLQGFLADKNEGAAFAKATGVSGIVDADESVLRELDPFVATTRRMLVPAP